MFVQLNYSSIYDKNWCLALHRKFNREKREREFETFISGFKEVWNLKEEKVLELLEEMSGLTWKEKKIPVFFVSHLLVSGFSNPLTIRMSDDYPKIANTLIHELAHKIMEQNDDEIETIYKSLKRRFPGEDIGTYSHIIVNALTDKVSEKVLGKEETDKAKNVSRNFKGLKRGYEILDNINITDDVVASIVKYCNE